MKTGVREGHTETLQSWRRAFGHFCENKGQITCISHQAVPFPLPFTMLIPSIYCKPKTNHASVTAFFSRASGTLPVFYLFEFSLAPRHIFLSSHWPLRLL